MMSEVKTINGPFPLHDASCTLRGAKNVLMNLHDAGTLVLDKGYKKSKDNAVYNEAAYQMLMNDEVALWEWLAHPRGDMRWEYYDHERDKKGKLLRCKARRI